MVLRAEDCAKVVALVEDGRSQRYVARVLNASHSTIQRVLARLRETGTNIRIPGCVETKSQLREVRGTEVKMFDMHLMYGLTHCNRAEAKRLYAEHFLPNEKTFEKLHIRLREAEKQSKAAKNEPTTRT
ncbi:hypothetical protein ILUMI_18957 [Ignelater luminosus]|uniref:Transposase IS30-like HTH domain-containing protein n=1 Tax=Ignelater luminosus TaxID=2038154 RepID=A0A8K0CLG3_IGNLU|nr:hypothetical protein ILUMI_18957 [Ignelater luminosus]